MKESKTYPPLPKMPIDQTLRGQYAESAMKGLLSNHLMIDSDSEVAFDWLIRNSFEIADRMIEEEFKK